MKSPQRCSAAVVTLTLVLVCGATPCLADDIYVTITADTNDGICGGPLNFPCSLRDAVISANARPGHDTIHVPAGTYNLTIAGSDEEYAQTGDLDITDDVTIVGSGADSTVIDALRNDRVFDTWFDATTVALHNLTIRGGEAGLGGGISATSSGLLLVANCTIEDNISNHPDAVIGGGGIFSSNNRTVSVFQSIVRRNRASSGSGLQAQQSSHLLITRSLVYQNFCTQPAPFPTGAVYLRSSATTEIANSTISHNEHVGVGTAHSGLLNHSGTTAVVESSTIGYNEGFQLAGDSTILLRNNIIDGECSGDQFTTEGGNVEGPGNTCYLEPGPDLYFIPIYLHPLGDYGGPTPTMPPVYVINDGNLAIDNISAAANCLPDDQHGEARPQDGNGNGSAVCDSGAVEVSYAELPFADGFETGHFDQWTRAVW